MSLEGLEAVQAAIKKLTAAKLWPKPGQKAGCTFPKDFKAKVAELPISYVGTLADIDWEKNHGWVTHDTLLESASFWWSGTKNLESLPEVDVLAEEGSKRPGCQYLDYFIYRH